MTDYGNELEFGVFLTPGADRLDQTLETAQRAEVSGLDLVTVQDHPYQGRFADTWTLLSVIGARTSAIRVAPNVASTPLRSPVILAKSAATLDLATGGRVELGLGAGAFWDAIVAAGGVRRTPGEAVDALVETIGIIKDVWQGGSVSRVGTHHQVKGLHGGPAPAHQIPIWLGAYKPRMLRLTGRLADAWIPSMGYADPAALTDLNASIDDAAVAAGRSPQSVRRIYNVFGRFGTGSGFLQGSPADWAEQLAGLALDEGMSGFILGTDEPDDVGRFATEVAPRVRELVGAARATDTPRPDHDEPSYPAVTLSSGPTHALTVQPTADDGARLTGVLAWDEEARPTRPVRADTEFTSAQQAAPQHLLDIHNGLREELQQVRSVLDQVRRGHLSVGAARSVINTMAIRQNNWSLGAFCQSYCRIVTGHHTLEDRRIFPHLRQSDPGLEPVLDRLQHEHEVIADVLDGLDRALVALADGDGYGRGGEQALDDLGHQVDLLTDTMLSHLAYEERELIEPLAEHGFG